MKTEVKTVNSKIYLLILIVGLIGGIVGAFIYENVLKNQTDEIARDKILSIPLTEISSYTLLQKMNNNDSDFVIVDVRDKAAYDLGHIKGAISIPLADITTNYDKLPKNKTIITYCWSQECMLGPTASAFLASKNILPKELRIGWCEWSERGYPIEGERYILSGECMVPQRSINNQKIKIIDTLPVSNSTSCVIGQETC